MWKPRGSAIKTEERIVLRPGCILKPPGELLNNIVVQVSSQTDEASISDRDIFLKFLRKFCFAVKTEFWAEGSGQLLREGGYPGRGRSWMRKAR